MCKPRLHEDHFSSSEPIHYCLAELVGSKQSDMILGMTPQSDDPAVPQMRHGQGCSRTRQPPSQTLPAPQRDIPAAVDQSAT
jgi:hypothetical protein